MEISYKSTDGRTLCNVNGRYLVWTNALQIEFLDSTKRFLIPLPSNVLPNVGQGSSVDPDRGFAFIIESDGYLVIEPKYKITYLLVGGFRQFDYVPIHSIPNTSHVWRPTTYVINNVSAGGSLVLQNGVYTYNTLQFQLLSSLGSFSNVSFLRAGPRFVATDINTLAAPYNNKKYLGPKAYPGLTFVS